MLANEIKNNLIEKIKKELGSNKVKKYKGMDVYTVGNSLRFNLKFSRFYPDSTPPTYWFELTENVISIFKENNKLGKNKDYFLFVCADKEGLPYMIYLIPASFIMSNKIDFEKGRADGTQRIYIDKISTNLWLIRQDKSKTNLSEFQVSIQDIITKISDFL